MNRNARRLTLMLVVALLALFAGIITAEAALAPVEQAPVQKCADLATLALPNTTITLTEATAAGTNVGGAALPVDICRVAGVISPTWDSYIQFEVWLPASGWNGKFNGVGNGGLAGFINYAAMNDALDRGYATASTDGGHVGGPPVPLGDATWALNHPMKIVDFGYRAVHLTTVNAKAIVSAYYGAAPRYSYFTGCSGGGQQGLAEAQRYPGDYNGVVSGAPAAYPTHMWPGELYPASINQGPTPGTYILTEDKLPLVTQAAINACDALDGLKDGLITDPRTCNFDPATLQCPAGQDLPTCLTPPQVDVVKKVYGGLKDPTTGSQFWYGYEPSSEIGWWGHVSEPFFIPIGYFKYMVYGDPNWDWHTYDFSLPATFNDLYAASDFLSPSLEAMNPDLSAFRKAGGKMIMWHGWIDQNISPRNSIAYYESVKAATNGRYAWDARNNEEVAVDESVKGAMHHGQIEQYLRLFMVPGMQHCQGGPGTDTFDALGALEKWVEKGVAPKSIPAAHLTNGEVDLTRPLCPYPQVARYNGKGDPNDAANFKCK